MGQIDDAGPAQGGRMGTGRKIGLGCGGVVVLLFLMGSCVNMLAGEEESAPATTTVTATVTATVTPTPAAATETVEVVETVTAEVTVTEEATVTVTETVTAEVQGFAELPPQPTTPEPTPEPPPPAGPVPPAGGWANCTEAWNAGAAPVYAGDPGYAPRLDGDGDGVGCENPPR